MKKAIIVFIVVLTASVLALSNANADDKYWVGGTGSWEDPTNWDPLGQPLGGDNVFLTSSDAIDRTVYHDKSSGEGVGNIIVDATGTGEMTLSISQGIPIDQSLYPKPYLYIGYNGTGTVNQTGGYFSAYSAYLGFDNEGSSGTYNLSEGTFRLSHGINVGETSTFNQTGGYLWIPSTHMFLDGTYNLRGNAESMINIFRIYETGVFNQSGGSLKTNIGVLHNYGTYNLSEGSFFNNKQFINDGTFSYSGGNMDLDDTRTWLTNNGLTNLSGEGTRTVKATEITNNGTWKTTNTTAVYDGTFINNGAYISDSSAQYFEDIIIGETGYLVGQYIDEFHIEDDFLNSSEMNADWKTRYAYLDFTDGEDTLHEFSLTGADFGTATDGYNDNFAWGTLMIEEGNFLELYDGNDDRCGALYLREIIGAEIIDDQIINIYNNDCFNIYYKANAAGNEYLDGDTYDLSGGGQLIPIFEPIINEILNFFDETIADGSIAGNGPGKSAEKRLNALRNMLVAVGVLIENGEIEEACGQAIAAYKKCDGDQTQSDFAAGDAVIDLSNMILDLLDDLECEFE